MTKGDIEEIGIVWVMNWVVHRSEKVVQTHLREYPFEIDLVTVRNGHRRYHEIRSVTTDRSLVQTYGIHKILTLRSFAQKHAWPRITLHVVQVSNKTYQVVRHQWASLYLLIG